LTLDLELKATDIKTKPVGHPLSPVH